MKDSINGKTKIVGLLGYPVGHSFSPRMHNAAFKHAGLDWAYVPFPVEPKHLGEACVGIRALGLAGVNVTIPHKSEIMKHLDWISPDATKIGAVNTVVNDNGILKGYNTDADGFLRSMEEETGQGPEDKTILILGAGGACRAVAFGLALRKAKKIYITARQIDRATALAKEIQAVTQVEVTPIPWDEDIAEVLIEVDTLINSTPIGMGDKSHEIPPISLSLLRSHVVVYDLIYNPPVTKLLSAATHTGLKAVNGLGMLLYQGVIAYELWTGHKAPVKIMRQELVNQVSTQ